MYISIGVFLFGAALSQCTTDLMKYNIGRLRPHFLDVCKPNWTAIACHDARGRSLYIDDYECLGEDKDLIKEARQVDIQF